MIIFNFIALLLSLPFIILSKLIEFRQVSELVSQIPTKVGDLIRYQFYKFSLNSCGKNVRICIGTIFSKKDINIGNNVYIGPYCSIGLVDLGDDIMIANSTHVLSGSNQHGFSRIDIPMSKQKGKFKRVYIDSDCWIGANCVIMSDLKKGCILAAGSILTTTNDEYSILAGNPAKVIKNRK